MTGSAAPDAPAATPANAPILALLRIDADAYDGVLDALDGAYHRLSVGGAVVIDDWHLGGARAAVHGFRRRFNITAPILPLPSDFVATCAPDLGGLAACDDGRGVHRLFVQNKDLITTIGQHAAHWRKGPDEPGPSPRGAVPATSSP